MGERIAKGGAFPRLVESTLRYEAGPAVVLRPGRRVLPYQDSKSLYFLLSLLGKCSFLQVSALSGPPGRRRPGIGRTPPRLEALAIEVGSISGVGAPRDVICHLCDPTGTRADYGPTPGPTTAPPHKTKSNPWGFKRGVPLLWLFVHFGQSKWTPAERPWKGAGFHLGNRRKTSPAERVSPRQGSNFAPEKWGEEQAPKAIATLRA